MTTDKQRAETWRRIADCYESLGNYPLAAANARRRADLLDPPKPTYPDGTVAWVTNQYGRRYLCTWHAENREWCIGGPDGDSGPGKVTKVEPLRVLADDENAVKRTKADYFGAGSDNWRIEANEVVYHHPAAADLCRAYADALDAEAGEQS